MPPPRSSALTLLLLVMVGTTLAGINSTFSGPGTTKSLSNIFMGRCADYQEIKRPNGKKLDCDDLWKAFMKAFAHKDPCDVNVYDYQKFLSMFPEDVYAYNQYVFWSGLYEMISVYTEASGNLVVIANTFMGYLVDSLIWCGAPGQPGINYGSCPTRAECGAKGQDYAESFWGAASAKFAREAAGDIYIYLNATRKGRPAYSKDSFLARYEVPNLSTTRVKNVNIVLVQDFKDPKRETCNTGSIPSLKELLANHRLSHTCVENPSAVRHYMCVDDPKSPDCDFKKNQEVEEQASDASVQRFLVSSKGQGRLSPAKRFLASMPGL